MPADLRVRVPVRGGEIIKMVASINAVSDLRSRQKYGKSNSKRFCIRNFRRFYTLTLWGRWWFRKDVRIIGLLRKIGRPENQSLTVP